MIVTCRGECKQGLEVHEALMNVSTLAAEFRKHAPHAEEHACWQPSSSAPQVAEQRLGSACTIPVETPRHLLQYTFQVESPHQLHCTKHACIGMNVQWTFCTSACVAWEHSRRISCWHRCMTTRTSFWQSIVAGCCALHCTCILAKLDIHSSSVLDLQFRSGWYQQAVHCTLMLQLHSSADSYCESTPTGSLLRLLRACNRSAAWT